MPSPGLRLILEWMPLPGAGTISNGPQQQPSVEGSVQEAAEEGGSHFVSELFRRAGECPHV